MEEKATKAGALHSKNERVSERVYVEIDPKDRSKINTKLCQGGVWVTPGDSLEPSGSRPGWFADATENLLRIKGFWEAPGTSRDAQMDPEGAQKSIENLLFGEKERSKRGFFVDFCAQCRFP